MTQKNQVKQTKTGPNPIFPYKNDFDMANTELMMAFLPAVFMIHEYEEIILFGYWLKKNREKLNKRFPKFGQFLFRQRYFDYSTATFAIGTAHLFLLISVVTFFSLWREAYQWWFAAFMGYFLHLFVHIIQWIIYRKYVPVIVSSLLTLPYCIYVVIKCVEKAILSPLQMLQWTGIGIILTVLGMLSSLFIMSVFHKRIDK